MAGQPCWLRLSRLLGVRVRGLRGALGRYRQGNHHHEGQPAVWPGSDAGHPLQLARRHGHLAGDRGKGHSRQGVWHLAPYLGLCHDGLRALGRQHVLPPDGPLPGRRGHLENDLHEQIISHRNINVSEMIDMIEHA